LTTAWFDNDQGRMSPDELEAVVFPTSRLGRRGYEEGPVREFLAGVHGEFVRLLNERTSLWQEVQRLRRRIIAGQADDGDEDSVLFGAEDAHVHAVRILSTAQVTAEKYVADARDYSSRLTKETRHRRDEIMTQARQHSDRIMQEAQAQAREAAVSALNGSDQPHSEKEWHAAQAELAYLRTYSGVYRAHLKAYTEGILRGIEEWERKESASLADAARRDPNPVPPPVTPPPNGRGSANGYGSGNGNGNENGHARRNGNGGAYLRH
jgi:cell division septum initiation protein DivIVA